jgi:hypothetical protein
MRGEGTAFFGNEFREEIGFTDRDEFLDRRLRAFEGGR